MLSLRSNEPRLRGVEGLIRVRRLGGCGVGGVDEEEEEDEDFALLRLLFLCGVSVTARSGPA